MSLPVTENDGDGNLIAGGLGAGNMGGGVGGGGSTQGGTTMPTNAAFVNGIGNLEQKIHRVFASARVPSEDFVYCSQQELYNMLDDYCDAATIHEQKDPFLLVGDAGSGKSALLANWLHRRRTSSSGASSISKKSDHGSLPNEFIFWHAVGCSRSSMGAHNLIRRLIDELKTKFQLAREMPTTKDRLSWELPRFFELAARKGPLIIVIDGLNRLMMGNDNNEEADLLWLPLEFPPNVRVILSVTAHPAVRLYDKIPGFKDHEINQQRQEANNALLESLKRGLSSNYMSSASRDAGDDSMDKMSVGSDKPADNEGGVAFAVDAHTDNPNATLNTKADMNRNSISLKQNKPHRILYELLRRSLVVVRLKPLEKSLCRGLVTSYLQKCTQVETAPAVQNMGAFLTSVDDLDNSMTSRNYGEAMGFLLFDVHLNSLMMHPQSGNPLFLRLLLRCAFYAVKRGFSLWHVWDDWLKADGLDTLIQRILNSFECGYTKTQVTTKGSCDRSLQAGGIPALRLLYPWHPSFGKQPDVAADYVGPVDVRSHVLDAEREMRERETRSKEAHMDGEGMDGSMGYDHKGSNHPDSILHSLGDQSWLAALELAGRKQVEANIRTQKILEESLRMAQSHAESANATFIDSLVTIVKRCRDRIQSRLNISENANEQRPPHLDIDNESQEDSDADSIVRGRQAEHIKTMVELGNAEFVTTLPQGAFGRKGSTLVMSSFEDIPDDELSVTTQQSDEDESDQEEKEEVANLRPSEITKAKQPSGSRNRTVGRRVNRMHASTMQKLDHDRKEAEALAAKRVNIDPKEAFSSLPIYLRGGVSCDGFGSLLGCALSLLYVARHGLKERELWAILSELRSKKIREEAEVAASKSGGGAGHESTHDSDPSRHLISFCYAARGLLEDVWKTQDVLQTGKISFSQMQLGMTNAHPSFKKADAMRLLEITGLSGLTNAGVGLMSTSVSKYDYRLEVDYMELIRRIVKKEKSMKHAEQPRHGGDKKKSAVSSAEEGLGWLAEPLPTAVGGEAVDEGGTDSHRDEAWLHMGSPSNEEGGSGGTGGDDDASLGPLMEESLLAVLCSLGVLYSKENQVLILPSDSEIFRQVVLKRYVESMGGREAWHGQLIRFFQRQPNSMRRCEEMPWHLQICRRWHALRDALVDLNTFNMMYALRGDGDDALKGEYMSYWLMLTEGPLYISDEAQRQAAAVAMKQHQNKPMNVSDKNAKILFELDLAAALGLSEKEAKRQFLKNQVAPFDLVEEFNKSVEAWVASEKPTGLQLRKMLLSIARFLASFSLRIADPLPFLRPGLDMQGSHEFGIKFEELRDDIGLVSMPPKQSDGTSDAVTRRKAVVTFPTPQLIAANYYPFIRWMWIQFPWISLDQASKSTSKMKSKQSKSQTVKGSGAAGGDQAVEMEGSDSQLLSISTREHISERRYWDVKKMEPGTSIVKHTQSRKTAALRCQLMSSKSQEALSNQIKHIQQDIAGVSRPPEKFRRTFEEEMELLKGIPFSEHCKKSMRLHTLFPSLDATLKQKNLEAQNDVTKYEQAAASLRRGGEGMSLNASIDDEIKKMKEEEKLQKYNAIHGGAIPCGNELAVEYEKEINRLGKLRLVYDNVSRLYRERKNLCHELKLQADNRDEHDEEIAAVVLSGETAIATLEQRYLSLNSSVNQAKMLNAGYMALLEFMEHCPPSTPSGLAALQQSVELATQQLKDLQNLRATLYLDAERLEQVTKRQFHAKISYYRAARRDLIPKRIKATQEFNTRVDSLLNIAGNLTEDDLLEIQMKVMGTGLEEDSTSGSRAGERDGLLSNGDAVGSAGVNVPTTPIANISAFSSISKALKANIEKRRFLNNLSQTNKITAPEPPKPTDENEDDSGNIIVEEKGDAQKDSKEAASGNLRDDSLDSLSTGASRVAGMVRQTFIKTQNKINFNQILSGMAKQTPTTNVYDKTSLEQFVIHAMSTSSQIRQDLERNAPRMQAQLMFDYIADRTGSTSEYEFVERFNQAQALTATLKEHQSIADSRMAQLRSEYNALCTSFGETLFLGESKDAKSIDSGDSLGDKATGVGESSDAGDARHLDNQVFSAEMRLNRVQRQVDIATQELNQVRMGVGHIMEILRVNEPLLSNLPKSKPPKLVSDADLAPCLYWMEERIQAISEATNLENTQQKGGNKEVVKSFFERQVDLAVAVQDIIKAGQRASQRNKSKKKKKEKGNLSKGLLSNKDFISRSNGVMVTAAHLRDQNFLEESMKVDAVRDQYAEQLEKKETKDAAPEEAITVKFIQEGLDTRAQKAMLLRANRMSQAQGQGKLSYGFALETLLKSKGPTLSSMAAGGKVGGGYVTTAKSTSKKATSATTDPEVDVAGD